MTKYHEKPKKRAVIDACKFHGTEASVEKVRAWAGIRLKTDKFGDHLCMVLPCGMHESRAFPGSWIVKDEQMNFRSIDDRNFKREYGRA